jgi:parallel beta-helix repeat protein
MSQMRGNGIQVYNTDDTQVIDNTISYVRDGIYVDYSRRATFRGNTVHHVRYGTHYMNTHNSSWEGNTVYQSRAGLALMEVRNLTVRNNVAWGNEDHPGFRHREQHRGRQWAWLLYLRRRIQYLAQQPGDRQPHWRAPDGRVEQ